MDRGKGAVGSWGRCRSGQTARAVKVIQGQFDCRHLGRLAIAENDSKLDGGLWRIARRAQRIQRCNYRNSFGRHADRCHGSGKTRRRQWGIEAGELARG